MNKLSQAISLVLATAAITTSAMAAPRVNGSTITWPADGWYQVLDANDYSHVCNGGSSCDVSPGRYIVINHTTGERFNNVVVRDQSNAPMTINVTGNTISWPDDGWYQVQRSDDYTSVCEGGRSCDVEDGVYTVINHTTGQRFPGVLVAMDDGEPVADPEQPEGPIEPPSIPGEADENGIVVSGNLISWPDNGYYQVQNADTLESICEGGTSCQVEPGIYIVINLTTGERFEGYVIEEGASSPEVIPDGEPQRTLLPAPEFARLDASAPYLIESLAGYQLEQAQTFVALVGDEIVSSAIGETTLDSGTVDFDDRDGVQSVPNQSIEYACSNGGTMVRESAVLDLDSSSYSHDSGRDTWLFTDCSMSTEAGDLLAGDYLLNGGMTLETDYVSGIRFTTNNQSVGFQGFSLVAPGQNELSIDGSSNFGGLNSFDTQYSRTVNIEKYEEVRDGFLLRDIRDGAFRLFESTEASGGLRNTSVDVSGRVLGTVTQGMDITISTTASLERTVAAEFIADRAIPFQGQLQLSSTDGSEMSITANPEQAEFDSPLLYDYSLMTPEGETITGSRQSLPALTIDAPAIPLF